jgi:hypothetical protein
LSTTLSTTVTGGSARMLSGGRDDVELVRTQFLQRQQGFVLPGQQHVADAALDEGGGGAARARVQHRHVGKQLAHEFLRLGFVGYFFSA